MNAIDLQIWDNAAFDGCDGGSNRESSWFPLQSLSLNQSSESLDPDSMKENRSPTPAKPNHPLKVHFRQGSNGGDRDTASIDSEIEEIEAEIGRLASRLAALRIKKAEVEMKAAKRTPMTDRRGFSLGPTEIASSVVGSSSVKKLQEIKEEEVTKKKKKTERQRSFSPESRPSITRRSAISTVGPMRTTAREYPMPGPASARPSRRGLTLGPSEIAATRKKLSFQMSEEDKEPMSNVDRKVRARQRGLSIGPMEITRMQCRRKSSFVGFPEFEEESLGPKSRPSATVGSVKSAKGRVIASRYSKITVGSGSNRRKWSLPEKDDGDAKMDVKKRALSVGKSQASLLEKKMSRITGKGKGEVHPINDSPSITRVAESLPKIRTIRCTVVSPRDSGRAKRVAELIGRKSYFTAEKELGESACQTLAFEEEE
ncbi:hypothetical protein QJS04_geneDACA003178 [Acorus gramineus]|uniref:Uncharacterized protein n=1 Tax=Acorus gramineus TaxID=55184 RepID=A0AAV9BWL8_ACOGR|nr:hypothetical protein QJS04_geneDACA003178 [Acorus gramineus]